MGLVDQLLGRDVRRRGSFSWGDRGTRRAMTAAAARTGNDSEADRAFEYLHQPWQARAFSYYNRMGECRDPANFVARALSKVRLYAATGTRDDPQEIASGWAKDLVDAWQKIPEPYGRLKSLIGEGRLTYSINPTDPEAGPVWEFLSPVELRRRERTVVRTIGSRDYELTDVSEEGGGEIEAGQIRMWRFWNPHPENSGWSDSPFRGVLDLYEQLWWTTLSERAELRNRVANQGLLLVPEEIDFEPEDEVEAALSDDPEADPFNERLQRVTMAALADPGGAAAASPAVVRAAAEWLKPDVFRHLRFHDPSASLYISGREDAILKRISIGLAMPVEEIMGLSIAKDWTAWKVEDEKYQYVEPEIRSLEEDLTETVLRAVGRAMDQADADDVFVVADVAGLVSDPDKGPRAIELRKIGAVDEEYVRTANDVDESAKLEGDERLEWLAIQLRTPDLLPGYEAPAAAPAPAGPPADEEPVSEEEEPPEDDGTDGDPLLATRLRTAATTLARAGAATFVRSRRRSCPECFEAVPACDDNAFVAAFGPERLAAVGIPEADLAARMRDAYFRAMTLVGMPEEVGDAHVIERWFAETIFDPDPPASWR